jgi:hypothetical protein
MFLDAEVNHKHFEKARRSSDGCLAKPISTTSSLIEKLIVVDGAVMMRPMYCPTRPQWPEDQAALGRRE